MLEMITAVSLGSIHPPPTDTKKVTGLAGGSVGWSVVPHTRRQQVPFPGRAHTWLQVDPVGRIQEGS